MKMWLNDKNVKESDSILPCYFCVFNKNVSYKPYIHNCLLQTFNVRNAHDWCVKGYEYENMA